jgi:hypothetical protein
MLMVLIRLIFSTGGLSGDVQERIIEGGVVINRVSLHKMFVSLLDRIDIHVEVNPLNENELFYFYCLAAMFIQQSLLYFEVIKSSRGRKVA